MLSPWKYIKQYHLGIEVGDTTDEVTLRFRNPSTSYNNTSVCEARFEDPNYVDCGISFSQSSSNYGVFLQQPFRRQGLWYLNWDVAITFKSLSGKFKINESVKDDANVPVNEIVMSSVHSSVYPYVTFGITPQSWWPDLIISISPVVGELAFGSLKLDQEKYDFSKGVLRRTGVLSLSTLEYDIVFARFSDGYFSFHFANHLVNSHVSSAPKIIPESLNGMTDITDADIEIRRSFFGFRLLFKK